MFATLRRKFKWNTFTNFENADTKKTYLLHIFAGLLEEILFWRTLWVTISFIACLHVVLLVCLYKQINFFQFIICLSITIIIMDGFETWLKYKHRIGFLKKVSCIESTNLNASVLNLKQWIRKQWINFIFIRETNHTKAFLLINIVLGTIFFIGKYISGYLVVYFICMSICFSYKIVPPVVRFFRHVIQDMESDSELEGLIPEASELNIKLLSIEPEKISLIDDKQSLDYWKPEELPIEEASDSSDNSSSIITNFSIEKIGTLQKDVDTSDSSEDEYIPLDSHHKDTLQSTLEVTNSSGSWSNSAYNMFWNITGAVANMGLTDKDNKRKRISSVESSDGFEMIDKNDFN